ncbi:hypothetical protein FB45DRAFT_1006841 [Roridomyces roridus]|uniref:Uncharacterized protein n=1 Tax=Roridomyces roridus TaxID=1738132 RepID=A0AAD7BGP3_9AGAR|nr:hypothetical protein FB45DRAFT_1006841 [Roridomyces roridus]
MWACQSRPGWQSSTFFSCGCWTASAESRPWDLREYMVMLTLVAAGPSQTPHPTEIEAQRGKDGRIHQLLSCSDVSDPGQIKPKPFCCIQRLDRPTARLKVVLRAAKYKFLPAVVGNAA